MKGQQQSFIHAAVCLLLAVQALTVTAVVSAAQIESYTNPNIVNCLASDGDYVWAGTAGGLVRWSRRDFSYRVFRTTDGLPGNFINSLWLADDGTLWIGTGGLGLAKYDGRYFWLAGRPATLGSPWVYCVTQDKSGRIWAGTTFGASVLENGSWTTYTTDHGLAGNWVTSIAVDDEGVIWFGTYQGGVGSFDGQEWSKIRLFDGLGDNCVFAVGAPADGTKWFGTLYGLTMMDQGDCTTYRAKYYVPDPKVKMIRCDRLGRNWFGTRHGVSLNEGRTWRTFTTEDGLPGADVSSVVVDDDGMTWIGTTDGGLCVWDGANFASLTIDNVLEQQVVKAIAIDSEDNKWLGTDNGFCRLSRDGSRLWFGADDGMRNALVNAVILAQDAADFAIVARGATSAESVWVGTAGGVGHLCGQSFEWFTMEDGLADNLVFCLAESPSAELWAGTRFGASRLDGDHWTSFTTADGLSNDCVFDIEFDAWGGVWFGTAIGASRFADGRFDTFGADDGLMDNLILEIEIVPEGPWLFGSGCGLTVFDGGEFAYYRPTDGLAFFFVNTIVCAQSDVLWLGTGMGVSRFDGEDFVSYQRMDGLCDGAVHDIAIDSQGDKWIATKRGLTRLTDDPADGLPHICLRTSRASYQKGEELVLYGDLGNRGMDVTVDAYVALIMPDDSVIFLPDFGSVPSPLVSSHLLYCHARCLFFPIAQLTIPQDIAAGTYFFAGVLIESETGHVFDNIALEQWELH